MPEREEAVELAAGYLREVLSLDYPRKPEEAEPIAHALLARIYPVLRSQIERELGQKLEVAYEAGMLEVRERLLSEAKKLERPNEPGEGFAAAAVREVKAQGIRDALTALTTATQKPNERS